MLQIIIYILSFLHASDRKEAALVCRRWYSASQDFQFQVLAQGLQTCCFYISSNYACTYRVRCNLLEELVC